VIIDFTDDTSTAPAANSYTGTWHEQLAKIFLSLATVSMADRLFGGATTKDETRVRTVINNPFPFSGGDFTITVDNMGKQIAIT